MHLVRGQCRKGGNGKPGVRAAGSLVGCDVGWRLEDLREEGMAGWLLGGDWVARLWVRGSYGAGAGTGT